MGSTYTLDLMGKKIRDREFGGQRRGWIWEDLEVEWLGGVSKYLFDILKELLEKN